MSPLLENLLFIITLEKSSLFYNMVSELSYQKYFKFVGTLTLEEVYQYYYNTDLLIFTSLLESFGLPLLEASQTGIQILSIDKPYANEVLNGYEGVLFANQDEVTDWVQKIEICANNIKRYPPFVSNYSAGWKEFIKFIKMETVI
jgi:glycosyltransferase involved in cell wall biosynthesis